MNSTVRVFGPGFATGGWTVKRLRPPYHSYVSDWESLWYCPTRAIARSVSYAVRRGRSSAQIAEMKSIMEQRREMRRLSVGSTARYYGNGIRIRYFARFRLWNVQRLVGATWADMGGWCGCGYAVAHFRALWCAELDAAANR